MAIAIFGIGAAQRDGLATLAGWAVAIASLAVLALLSQALIAAAVAFFVTLGGLLGLG